LERPTTNVSKVSRGSSGEPPCASWLGAACAANPRGSAPSVLAWLWRGGAACSHDPAQRGRFRLPAQQDLLAVMRLHPGLEEAGRDREPHRVALDALQVHAREPAGEDVLADLRAQARLHAQPAFLIRAMVGPLVRVRLGDMPV
jgi:hypothetical protein